MEMAEGWESIWEGNLFFFLYGHSEWGLGWLRKEGHLLVRSRRKEVGEVG